LAFWQKLTRHSNIIIIIIVYIIIIIIVVVGNMVQLFLKLFSANALIEWHLTPPLFQRETEL